MIDKGKVDEAVRLYLKSEMQYEKSKHCGICDRYDSGESNCYYNPLIPVPVEEKGNCKYFRNTNIRFYNNTFNK